MSRFDNFKGKASNSPGMANIQGGTIGSTRVNTPSPKPEITVQPGADVSSEEELVAVYSTRNVTWDGVGKISRGYNIMTKSKAEKWLARNHTKLATPEEVAKEYEV